MKLASKIAAIATASTLTGAVLLIATVPAQACIYSQQGGITNNAPSSNPTVDPTTTQVDSGNFNQLGIFGASFVLLGGLLAGGLLLKRQFNHRIEPLKEDTQTEALPHQLPEPLSVASEFAIEIPPEVIQSIEAAKASDSEFSSVR